MGEDKKYIDSVTTVSTANSSVEGSAEKGEAPERAAWGGQLEFILTCVGYAVGLGNVWRFPYLCYSNGGGAFLIPYVIMLSVVGLPLFYMELCLGQFASLGPIAVWKFNPMLKGLGFASVAVSFLIAIYYNVIIAVCIYFLFLSMAREVPWATCGNWWNTAACRTLADLVLVRDQQNSSSNSSLTLDAAGNATSLVNFTTTMSSLIGNATTAISAVDIKTPSEEFFYNFVLRLTDGLNVPGRMRWELAGCLLLAWVIVAIVLIRGISSLGKVVYFTALFPYVLLTILLIRGALLDGASKGILYYMKPDFSKLASAKVWSDACIQIFYSLSAASGGLIAMSSYNKFNNNVFRDSLLVPIINCCTSVYAGFVIFSVLGYMSEIKQLPVSKVAAAGPGLTFVVYPEALSTMPLPPLWSILFFFMMMTLGFSSEFSMMECVLTAFLDEFPSILKTSRKREFIFRISVCVFGFLCGLPMCCSGGFYLLMLVDSYVGGFPLLIVGIGELIAVNWIYGFRRFNEDVKMMLGRNNPIYLTATLTFIAPVLMLGVLVFTAYQYQPLSFQGYIYSPGYNFLGWCIVLFSVCFIPIIAFMTCFKNGGKEVLIKSSAPLPSWRPANAIDRVGTRYEEVYGADDLTSGQDLTGAASGSSSDGRSNGRYELSQMSIPPYDEANKL